MAIASQTPRHDGVMTPRNYRASIDRLLESRRVGDFESQLDRGRNLVDVLAPGLVARTKRSTRFNRRESRSPRLSFAGFHLHPGAIVCARTGN
jgi:hypothetical protein